MEPTNVVEEQLESMLHGIEEYGDTDFIDFGPFTAFSGIEGSWVGPIILDPDMPH